MLNEALNDPTPGKDAMVKYGYNPKTMDKKERLKILFWLTKQGWYKKDKALGRFNKDTRSSNRDPRYYAESVNDYTDTISDSSKNKGSIMENETGYTSFSDFITENAIKDNAMGLVYTFVTENFDALVEQASEGNSFALAMLENANDIEEYFNVGE